MSESVNLPALGESVTEGTVTRWLKAVGDRVEVDEPLLEVSTDKVDTEIPSPIAGVIEEILVAEDETAEVGAPLVRIGDGSGSSDDSDSSGDAADEKAAETEEPAAEEPSAETETEEKAPEPAADESSDESAGGDSTEVTLPALGESVTEGTVTRWLKAVGDDVEVDEPLLEVSTDKVDTEIPSPVAGKLQEIRVAEDETAEVGAVLAVIGSGGSAPAKAEGGPEPVAAAPSEEREEPVAEPAKTEEAPKEEAPAPKEEAKPAAPKDAEDKPAEKKAAEEKPAEDKSGGSDAAYVTPLVRRLAKDQGVDLQSVKGTGVGGRIRKQDVLEAAEAAKKTAAPAAASAPAAAPAPAPAPAPAQPSAEAAKLRGTVQKAPRIRQTIARRMRESLEISAQLTQVIEVDMSKVARLRTSAKDNFQAQNGAKLTFLPFISKAVTEALKQHPKLNASFDEEAKEITYHDAEHLAIAVDTEKGLLVPVINDAGNLNLAGLAKKIADVGSRTRSGKIGPDELSGGTFTITNIGSVGALFDTPIINQPQVGILGTGAIVKRPVVVTANGEDTIAIRSMMYLSLSYDHRLVDGADAGRFLQSLKARLEAGAFESDLGL
ncbi:2-oxoglutarate dehydrogenase, E2 component, dihydrolipoamide succinyltransferase [Arthrobacter sp. CAN_A1]|uniref:2-oxoglutarate dehydrogenase, E2 component, dihydrolipoamide succinyltransferase n=1 Tax=Arthrobacter sp. CAN_A1 TaxID=2787717 RepID=UPI0018CA7C7F